MLLITCEHRQQYIIPLLIIINFESRNVGHALTYALCDSDLNVS